MATRYFRILFTAALLLIGALTSHAQTVNTWTGQTDTRWSVATNWSLNKVPEACHDVVIPAGAPRYPVLQGDVRIQTLRIDDNASVSTNDFDIYFDFDKPFSVFAQGGALACGSGVTSLPLTARVMGGDTASYRYVWLGPAGDTLSKSTGAPRDTLIVNTPQSGVKVDSAITIVYFRSGFAVAPGADYTAVISGGSSNPASQVTGTPGIYTLIVTDPLTGCRVSDTARVVQTGGPVITIVVAGGGFSCLRDSVQLSATVSPAGTAVTWNGPGVQGVTTPTLYARAAGTYTASATGLGCTVSESVTLGRDATNPTITLPDSVVLPCTTALTLRPTGAPANATYRWTGPGLTQTVITDSLAVTMIGTYRLTVTHPTSGCVDSASVRVVENPACAPADSSCFVYIKAVDAANRETNRLPRAGGGSTWGNLTLSTEDLDSAASWNYGATRQWLRPDGTTVNAPTIAANQVGQYRVTLNKQGRTCEANIILTGTSCHAGDTTYACNPNVPLPVIADDPARYLQNLTYGDTIFAGDFIAIVLQVDGGSAATGWTGIAKVKMPYLGGSELSATFTNAKVNDCYELVAGSRIETIFDPSAGGILDIDDLVTSVTSELKDLLLVYVKADSTKLRTHIQKLEELKTQYANDENIPAEAKVALANNITVVQGKLGEVISCPNPAVNGRVGAGSCVNPEEVVQLINMGLPTPIVKLDSVILEFGSFQWETDISDISDEIHSVSDSILVKQWIVNEGGDFKNWNRYKNWSTKTLKLIYEEGNVTPSLIGVRDVLTKRSADIIISNLYNGNRKEVSFLEGDPVSNQLLEYLTVQNSTGSYGLRYLTSFINRILPSIKNGNFKSLTGQFVFDPVDGIGLINFNRLQEIPLYDFYAIMGGTQKVKAVLTLKNIVNKTSNNLNDPDLIPFAYETSVLDVTFDFIDWYGADPDDIGNISSLKNISESLKALFMLQHYQGVAHPFQTKIRVKPIKGYVIK